MPAIDVQSIAEGLATNLRTVAGDLQIVPYYDDSLPTDASWLVGEVGLKSGQNETNIERGMTTGATFVLHFEVTIYLAHIDPETAQKRMLAFMGFGNAASIWDAIESDLVIGGRLQKLIVQRSHGYAVTQRDSQRLIMNSWDVDATASV